MASPVQFLEGISLSSGKKGIILAGGLVGLLAVLLVHFGNPANMGFCIACFIRDMAGGLGLHRAGVVQYIRPEIIGMAIGAWLISLAKGDFRARGGSSPFTRFILGFFVMIGALMFLGCPLRMVLRLAGGDLTAILGLVGFTAGIGLGIVFLNKGFTLRKTYSLNKAEGFLFPALQVAFFILLIAAPAFIFFSESGPGSMHAPVAISLIAGLLVGVVAQRTRMCTVGGIRDFIMFRDTHLISGFLAILVVALIGNIIAGNFKLGFTGQPVAHNDGLWNFLGMALAGLGSVLLGGCPLRQIILSAEGNIDSVITFLGLLVGAAFAHNFGLASSAAGPTANGKAAVMIGFVVVLVVGFLNMNKSADVTMKGDVKLGA
jgi:YedE family putative selenium metabolism protein